jgi:hypothetical protein
VQDIEIGHVAGGGFGGGRGHGYLNREGESGVSCMVFLGGIGGRGKSHLFFSTRKGFWGVVCSAHVFLFLYVEISTCRESGDAGVDSERRKKQVPTEPIDT